MKTISPLCLFLLLLIIPVSVSGLEITVFDKDLEIPLEGVMISTSDTEEPVYTDADGKVQIEIDPALDRTVLLAQLIGYEPRKVLVRDFSKPLRIELLMEGILEGEELVVIEEAIGETDEEVGTSTVIEKEVIESSAKIGIIEDVMSSVKILPGVSFAGSFNSYLSVRGGAPGGLTAVQDGFVVKNPYHWGGGFSIFNPNIVESVKFSPGIFTAKYGDASSGLLEVTTAVPDNGTRYSLVQSMSTAEAFVETPLGTNGGILGGVRLTNYDLSFQLTRSLMEEQGTTFSRIPYIYDGYLKLFYRPDNKFEWYLNGFIGNDGIGMEVTDEFLEQTDDGIVNDFDFKYYNTDTFVNTGVKLLPGDKLLLSLLGGYEYWIASVDGMMREYGTREYSENFVNHPGFGTGLTLGDTYTIDMETNFVNEVINQGGQFRLDADFAATDSIVWQNGAGAFYDVSSISNDGNYYYFSIPDDYDPMNPTLNPITYEHSEYTREAEDTSVVKSFYYSNLEWSLPNERFSVDLGARIDHSYIWNNKNLEINTFPVINPRLNMRYRLKPRGTFFREQTVSLGTGLFSKTPLDALAASEDMDLDTVKMPKTYMSVMGWETQMPADTRFRIEGYYKYIFDRMYYTGNETLKVHSDGFGHAAGFDILLDRKTSRYWDGMISYSYIWARYKDPNGDDSPISNSPNESDWYYPSFHRFHTLNFLVNLKPVNWFTMTTKLSFASGTPMEEYGDSQVFGAVVENSDGSTSYAEMYTRETFYSDSKRTWISLPLDIKFTFHNYYKNSKLAWEFYLAAQDILSYPLQKMAPQDSIQTNKYTGEDTRAPSSSFSFTMISLGFKLTY